MRLCAATPTRGSPLKEKTVDIRLLRRAEECGCIIYWAFNHAWYDRTVDGHKVTRGPFRSLDEAAISAVCLGEGN